MTSRPRDWSLISVHLPKTAGTSFAEVLRRGFGDALRVDNQDRPLSHSRTGRRLAAVAHACQHAGSTVPFACVHGHFLPVKYALARRTRFCIWLRDPIQRVVSRYHHYLRHGQNEPQHLRWGLVPGLSLEQFAALPQYHNTYAEYLWCFPLARFDFVGVVEHYEEDIARFVTRFELPLALDTGVRTNFNPERDAARRYELEPAQERLLRRFNARDLALYEQAMRLRS
jgi:hypothetical protein